MAHDVFLSYSSKDKFAADAACAVLERSGVRVWMAPRDILPGSEWGASIIDAINASRAVVLVFSGNTIESKPVRAEVERAFNKGLPVIPFRIEDVQPSGSLELFLNASHWLDAYTKPLEQHLDRLAEVVRRVLQMSGASRIEDGPRRDHPVGYGRVLSVAVGLALVAIVAAGVIKFTYFPDPNTNVQQVEFDEAMNAHTIPALESFLSKYPNGPLSQTAIRERERLKAKELAPSPPPAQSPNSAPGAWLPVVSNAPAVSQPVAPISDAQKSDSGAASEVNNYSVRRDVSGGVLNMRRGPGQGHSIVVAIPAGAGGLRLGECASPDDNRSRHLWCFARWNGFSGWISRDYVVQQSFSPEPTAPARFPAPDYDKSRLKEETGLTTTGKSYSVRSDVSEGILNMRNGPGQGHSIVVAIPAGAHEVRLGTCTMADDKISRHAWCRVIWRNYSGWVSQDYLIKD